MKPKLFTPAKEEPAETVKKPSGKDLISEDISRCNNHRCAIRTFCARYMQLKIDRKKFKTTEEMHSTIPLTRFSGNKNRLCENFLNVNVEKEF